MNCNLFSSERMDVSIVKLAHHVKFTEGSIGHDLVIKPLPHNLSPNKDISHHVIYKRDTLPLDHLSDFASEIKLKFVCSWSSGPSDCVKAIS
uniref:Uncharacterized protein n=1 Tax=Glossina palpalis gambiensis TaxID=67801 RepID=A0A1B0BNI2_9MUSC